MEVLFYGMMIVLLIGAVILTARLLCYERQMAHLLKELKLLEETDTKILLTSLYPAGKTNEVISSFNRVAKKYRQAIEKLSKENDRYRESITLISHDIRTPLASVKGYVQMLSSPKAGEGKKEEYRKVIERRLKDLTELLDQLFEYARLEAGEMAFEMERLNACNIFAETISMFYHDFLEKGCEPEVAVSSKPLFINADRHAFTRMTENLIKNAIVHGTGEYKLSLEQEREYAAIRVSNRTESIEAEDMERIFDRFYTTDRSRSRKQTGLGLAIVKEFAEQMGGTAAACLEGDVFTIVVKFRIPPEESAAGR